MVQSNRSKTKVILNWTPGPLTLKTPYGSATVSVSVPEQAGVYVLTRRGTDGKHYSFYVGQASSLRRRLLEHLTDNEPNACIRNKVTGPCGFQYALVASSAQRDAAEAAIYHAHPDWYPCNDRGSMPSKDPSYDVEIGF